MWPMQSTFSVCCQRHQGTDGSVGSTFPKRLESLALLPLCERQWNSPEGWTLLFASVHGFLTFWALGLGPSLSPAELHLDRTVPRLLTPPSTCPAPCSDPLAWDTPPL